MPHADCGVRSRKSSWPHKSLQVLQQAVARELDYAESHFAEHADYYCSGCMQRFADAMVVLVKAEEYLSPCASVELDAATKVVEVR